MELSSYSRLFFDLDGLLVDTEPFHFEAYKRLLASHGAKLPWNFLEYLSIAHRSAVGLKEETIKLFPHVFKGKEWMPFYQQKKEIYLNLLTKVPLKLMPGVYETLKFIQEKNISHAVVTHSTKEQTIAIKKHLPILEKIPIWITREDYDSPKPAPDGYLKAIEILGETDHMAGFEDSLRGIRSLQQAKKITPVLICSSEHPQMKTLGNEQILHFNSFTDLLCTA